MHIYLDESGNLTKSNGDYFIVASFTVGDPRRITNAFRKWQRRKFPRKLRVQTEVKFNDPHIDNALRIRTLKFLTKQDVPKEYRGKKGTIQTGRLYTEIVGETLALYLPLTEREFRVFRDQRILKGITLNEFNDLLKTKLLPQLPSKAIIQIQAMDSTSSVPIQIADWLCGALARYHERKPFGDEFYAILKKQHCQDQRTFFRLLDKKMGKVKRSGGANGGIPKLKTSVPLVSIQAHVSVLLPTPYLPYHETTKKSTY